MQSRPLVVLVPVLTMSLVLGPAAFGASTALSVERSRGATAESNPFYADLRTGESFELEVSDPEIVDADGASWTGTIRGTVWTPKASWPEFPVLVYNHGLQDHQGWFFRTAEDLVAHGYPVIAFDRVGSGISDPGATQKHGVLQEAHGHVGSWRVFLDSLDSVVAEAGRRFPGRDIVLWGNGYGAKVVTAYLFDREGALGERRVAGAVFTSPDLAIGDYGLAMDLRWFEGKVDTDLLPTRAPARGGDNGADWYAPPGDEFEKIRGDELSLRKVTKRFIFETREMDHFLEELPEDRRLPFPTMNVMVIDDPLTSYAATRDFLSQRGGWGQEGVYYDTARRHSLLHGRQRNLVLGEIESYVRGF